MALDSSHHQPPPLGHASRHATHAAHIMEKLWQLSKIRPEDVVVTMGCTTARWG